jgi:hypothetical protein
MWTPLKVRLSKHVAKQLAYANGRKRQSVCIGSEFMAWFDLSNRFLGRTNPYLNTFKHIWLHHKRVPASLCPGFNDGSNPSPDESNMYMVHLYYASSPQSPILLARAQSSQVQLRRRSWQYVGSCPFLDPIPPALSSLSAPVKEVSESCYWSGGAKAPWSQSFQKPRSPTPTGQRNSPCAN